MATIKVELRPTFTGEGTSVESYSGNDTMDVKHDTAVLEVTYRNFGEAQRIVGWPMARIHRYEIVHSDE